MTKATPKSTKRTSRAAREPILGGFPPRPYPGVRSVPAKVMRRAIEKVVRERLARERAAATET